MTIDQVDEKLAELREAKKQRMLLQKKREIRKRYMQDNSFRTTENQIKYMLGGMLLSIWGKAKSIRTLEKTNMKDDQKRQVEKFAEHYKKQIDEEISKIPDQELKKDYKDCFDAIQKRKDARDGDKQNAKSK